MHNRFNKLFTPISYIAQAALQNNISRPLIKKITQKLPERITNHLYSHTNPAQQLERKIWQGFSEQAIQDLCSLKNQSNCTKTTLFAHWALARWYWTHQDYSESLKNLHQIKGYKFKQTKSFYQSVLLLEISCLINLKKIINFNELLLTYQGKYVKNNHLLLAEANIFNIKNQEENWITTINQILNQEQLAIIKKKNLLQKLSITNIHTPTSKKNKSQKRVSIIMPAFNAEKTIKIALDSLIKQTWTNLEIIIVDDFSNDNTLRIAQQYAKNDSRIKVLHLTENQGLFSCRNHGINHATGHWITTHDADDWSHAQKIEIQASHLLNNPKQKVNISSWVRVLPDLLFQPTTLPSERWITKNNSSLMLDRELLIALGGWDSIRFAGDTELIWRLEKHLKLSQIPHLFPQIPLSFALETSSSLTRTSRTHVNTIYHGIRHQYRMASKFWHNTAPQNNLKISHDEHHRSFPAPSYMLSSRPNSPTCYETVHIMDFNQKCIALEILLKKLRINNQKINKTAIFNWPNYNSPKFTNQLPVELLELHYQGKVHIITPGDEIKTKIVIIWDNQLMKYKIDLPPIIQSSNTYTYPDININKKTTHSAYPKNYIQ